MWGRYYVLMCRKVCQGRWYWGELFVAGTNACRRTLLLVVAAQLSFVLRRH
jgi:hypothetical protein